MIVCVIPRPGMCNHIPATRQLGGSADNEAPSSVKASRLGTAVTGFAAAVVVVAGAGLVISGGGAHHDRQRRCDLATDEWTRAASRSDTSGLAGSSLWAATPTSS